MMDDKDLEIMNLEHENKLLKEKCDRLIDIFTGMNGSNMMSGFDYIVKLARKLWESEELYGNSSEEAYADRHAFETACRVYAKCFGNKYSIKLEGTVLTIYGEDYRIVWQEKI